MNEYKPNEIIVDRACELWVRMLSKPEFNAIGKEGHGDDPKGSMHIAQCLATMNADAVKAEAESLNKFRTALKKYLMQKVRWEREAGLIFDENGHYETGMNVDYHPDWALRQAAKESGIAEDLFPWKTNMYVDENSIALSYGDGAETVYHYPIDGKWLIIKLRGSDIDKVIEYAKGGKPEFIIEG